MHQQHVLASLLTFTLFGACITETDESDQAAELAGTNGSTGAVPPPDPGPPRIRGLVWHWSYCDPSVPALPMSLTVKVALAGPDDSKISLKGQATGCKPFDANGVTTPCETHLAEALRTLQVSAADSSGVGHTVTTPIVDCTDGEAWFPPDDDGDAQ